MGKTSIEWTQETWNPVRGCSRISPGCTNCYAERMAARGLPGHSSPTTGEPFAVVKSDGPHWTGKVELIPHMLDVPLKRRKPTTYFVNSMSDLFHESLSDEDILAVFQEMGKCQHHTFQVLTKRTERMRRFLSGRRWRDLGRGPNSNSFYVAVIRSEHRENDADFLPNVWLGTSVEDQQRADERIPHLLQTPAAVRFLSVEPLLGPVDLSHFLPSANCDGGSCCHPSTIDLVIVGGESGPGARPCDIAWIRSIVAQCKAAGVACFMKQLGARPIADGPEWVQNWTCGASAMPDLPSEKRWLRLFDRKGGDIAEWPEDLRIREMPTVVEGGRNER